MENLAIQLFQRWNAALQTGDPQTVADCYADDAVLLPTLSSRVRTDRDGIVDYFGDFLLLKPVGRLDENHVHATDNLLVHSGLYSFSCRLSDDIAREVHARFTYFYRQTDDDWKIIAHHSSLLPEQ